MPKRCATRRSALSGLLSHKMGGPSVYPPQPDGLWKVAFNGGQNAYPTSKGEDRYRRGIYTFWRRTMPPPSMTTFDAPSRESCTLRRLPTNTPLQAFVTMNDPVFVECAQALGAAHRSRRRRRRGIAPALCACSCALAARRRAGKSRRSSELYADELAAYRADPAAAEARHAAARAAAGRRRCRGDGRLDGRRQRAAESRRRPDQELNRILTPMNLHLTHARALTRREFLTRSGKLGLGAMALQGMLPARASPPRPKRRNPLAPKAPPLPSKIKSVIYLAMSGAPPQHDLFDWKPELVKHHLQDCPEEFLKGQTFAFIKGRPKLLRHAVQIRSNTAKAARG